MKKVLLIAVLMFGLLIIACDKQGALESIMQDPGAKSYILQQMFTDDATRAEMADSTFANIEFMNTYFTELAGTEEGKSRLLGYLIAADTTGEWITAKLAETPELKTAMKDASKR